MWLNVRNESSTQTWELEVPRLWFTSHGPTQAPGFTSWVAGWCLAWQWQAACRGEGGSEGACTVVPGRLGKESPSPRPSSVPTAPVAGSSLSLPWCPPPPPPHPLLGRREPSLPPRTCDASSPLGTRPLSTQERDQPSSRRLLHSLWLASNKTY